MSISTRKTSRALFAAAMSVTLATGTAVVMPAASAQSSDSTNTTQQAGQAGGSSENPLDALGGGNSEGSAKLGDTTQADGGVDATVGSNKVDEKCQNALIGVGASVLLLVPLSIAPLLRIPALEQALAGFSQFLPQLTNPNQASQLVAGLGLLGAGALAAGLLATFCGEQLGIGANIDAGGVLGSLLGENGGSPAGSSGNDQSPAGSSGTEGDQGTPSGSSGNTGTGETGTTNTGDQNNTPAGS